MRADEERLLILIFIKYIKTYNYVEWYGIIKFTLLKDKIDLTINNKQYHFNTYTRIK